MQFTSHQNKKAVIVIFGQSTAEPIPHRQLHAKNWNLTCLPTLKLTTQLSNNVVISHYIAAIDQIGQSTLVPGHQLTDHPILHRAVYIQSRSLACALWILWITYNIHVLFRFIVLWYLSVVQIPVGVKQPYNGNNSEKKVHCILICRRHIIHGLNRVG